MAIELRRRSCRTLGTIQGRLAIAARTANGRVRPSGFTHRSMPAGNEAFRSSLTPRTIAQRQPRRQPAFANSTDSKSTRSAPVRNANSDLSCVVLTLQSTEVIAHRSVAEAAGFTTRVGF